MAAGDGQTNDAGREATPIAQHERCPECGAEWLYKSGEQEFSRVVGIVSQRYDRLVEWVCPACDHRWGRDAEVAADSQETPDA